MKTRVSCLESPPTHLITIARHDHEVVPLLYDRIDGGVTGHPLRGNQREALVGVPSTAAGVSDSRGVVDRWGGGSGGSRRG